MKKVAFYIESMVVGGAEKVLIDLVNHMDYTKYDVTVIAVFKQSVYSGYTFQFDDFFNPQVHYKTLVDNGNSLRYLLFNYAYAHVDKRILYSCLIKEQYDIEIAFYEGLPTEFVSHSTNPKSRKLAWLHTDNTRLYDNQNPQLIAQKREIYKRYHQVLGVSNQVCQSFREFFPDIDVKTAYSVYDIDQILEKAKSPIRWTRGQETEFLAVGRMIQVKGYDRLINACNRLQQEGFSFHVTMLGDGELKEKLETAAGNYGLQDKISFLGMQKNPYAYMSRSDYFLCTSYAEGFSTVAVEAILCGLPVLTTDCGGARDIFGEEQCGIIGDNSEEGIYAMMKQVLLHQEKRNEFMEACDRRQSFFLTETRVNAICELMEG